ncbi:MAG: helix-turn-helix domain-containing protein [Clostridia bacterium]|nr:helix-turn-helix domain-containing protein [Clostridia bacterium]
MKNNISYNLRALRDSHNLTQENVADVLNMSRSTYAYYESGTHEPSLETVSTLAKMYNISIDQIVSSDFVLRSPQVPYKTMELQYFDELTEDEREIILKFRVMSDEKKEQIKKQVDELK